MRNKLKLNRIKYNIVIIDTYKLRMRLVSHISQNNNVIRAQHRHDEPENICTGGILIQVTLINIALSYEQDNEGNVARQTKIVSMYCIKSHATEDYRKSTN